MSILIKENPVYRACEHVFIGATAGYLVVATIANTIMPGIQENMMTNGEWWEIIPICLGLMIYFQPFPKYRWISRFPVAYWIGYNAGLSLTIRTFMPLMANVNASMVKLIVIGANGFDLLASFTNIVFASAIIFTLLYFLFSFEAISNNKVILSGARWFIMIAFGASFGNTVMGRISLVLGRAQFILGTWLGVLPQ